MILPTAVIIFSVLLGFAVAIAIGQSPVPALLSAAQDPLTQDSSAPISAVPPAALRDCTASIDRGEAAIAAATTAHRNWSGHVQAQLDYDEGRTTMAQTRQTWADTKATAEADVVDFRAARERFEEKVGGCATDLVGGTDVDGCAMRLTGVRDALQAGGVVVDDWARHIEMMSDKKEMEPAEYGQMWREMVAAAPVNLDAFTAAAARLDGLPACPVA